MRNRRRRTSAALSLSNFARVVDAVQAVRSDVLQLLVLEAVSEWQTLQYVVGLHGRRSLYFVTVVGEKPWTNYRIGLFVVFILWNLVNQPLRGFGKFLSVDQECVEEKLIRAQNWRKFCVQKATLSVMKTGKFWWNRKNCLEKRPVRVEAETIICRTNLLHRAENCLTVGVLVPKNTQV